MASEMVKRALYGTPKVGGDCLSFCTRCKMELAHVIVSMIDGRPAKVLCKTCRTQHNFRRAEPVSRAASGGTTRTPRVAAPKSVVRVAEVWQKKLAESKSVPQPYNVKSGFRNGDIIEHPKFGPGIVENAGSHNKMVVLFRDGEKTLIHAGVPANASGT
jgi:hypothetical protein